MKTKILFIAAIVLPALVMFSFRNKPFNNDYVIAERTKPAEVVLGMVLLNEVEKIDFGKIVDELQNKYGVTVTGQDIDDEKKVGVFQYKNSQIAILQMGTPIPGDELKFPSEIAYLWPDAKDLTPIHKGHIIISVSSTDDTKLNMFMTFTKVASSVLTNTNSLGIYLGNQTLVLSKSFYVNGANSMTQESLPLMNWIYFGLRHEKGKNSGYTFGLTEFGFDELEILDSRHTAEEILDMLFNASHYVILSNVTLRDGETVGFTAQQKIKIVRSKGVLLEGTTLKLKY